MKIRARVVFEGAPVYFEVPVGLGDKSFKWLGMVVSQRFALLAPNGGLRRRDPIRRGASDSSMHQAVQIVLPGGAFPHPQALISDFLRDGDEVGVSLVDHQEVATLTGLQAAPTKWSTLAFNATGEGVYADESKASGGGGGGGGVGDDEGDGAAAAAASATAAGLGSSLQMAANADFMRIILKSQMINRKKIVHTIETHWNSSIRRGMPRLLPAHEEEMKASFVEYWDVLVDVFERFAPDGKLSKSALHSIFDEAGMFPPQTLGVMAARVHKRACDAAPAGPGESLLGLPGFMVAILLCAQFIHNDTYSATAAGAKASADEDGLAAAVAAPAGSPHAALREIFSRKLYALAERLECYCVLKDIFTSEPILAVLRDYHSDLSDAFTKFAGRSREMPVSINAQNLSELFYDGGLVDEKVDRNNTPAIYLFKEVRKGTVFGRSIDPSLSPDDIPPENELTYPEMVEAVCRHGFYKHRGVKPDEDGNKLYLDYGGTWTIRDCFIDALNGARRALRDPRSEGEDLLKQRGKR